jgi:hypothetical protein
MQNQKSKMFLTLLTPSAMSAVFYTFLAGLIIVLNQFDFIQKYLQIPQNVNFMRMFLDWLDHTVTSLLGDTKTQAIVVGLFWAVVGLGVYVFLKGVAHFISDLEEGADERNYIWPRGTNRNRALLEAMERNVFRVFAFIGLIVMLFGPLARALRGPVFLSLVGNMAVLKYLVWFLVIWVILHISVVFLRLIVLKPRLFN